MRTMISVLMLVVLLCTFNSLSAATIEPTQEISASPAVAANAEEAEDELKWFRFENESAVICLLFDKKTSFHYMKLSKVFSLGAGFFEYCAYYPGKQEKPEIKGSLGTVIIEATGLRADGTLYFSEHQNRIASIDISKDPQYVSGSMDYLNTEFMKLDEISDEFFNSFVTTVSNLSNYKRETREFFCPLGKLFIQGFVILIERHEFSNALKTTLLKTPEIKQ